MSRRVLILSADIGDGHTTAARALAAMLRERGATVHVDETLRSLGRIQRLVLRDGSRFLFRYTPRLFGAYYRLLLRFRPARAMAARSLKRFGASTLLRMVDEHRPDLIVSTYPATTVVLGALRRTGQIDVPAIATITDVAGLFFWAHPGIDLHLVSWAESIEEVLEVAPGTPVHAIPPLTSTAFFQPTCAADARRRLGLPASAPIVLVSGGGWGVGDLAGAIAEASSVHGTFTVCVAGRDERVRAELEHAFATRDDVLVLGFSERMSDLLAAADVLIHGTGGVTCLEARLRSCPVILYGFAVGHVHHNATVMERLGLVARARRRADLKPLIEQVLASAPVPAAMIARPTADLVLDAKPLAKRSPMPPARMRLRPRSGLIALTAALVASFAVTEPGEAAFHRIHLSKLPDASAQHVARSIDHIETTLR